ncbi:DNA helicase [Tanacetum coccineum]|uniref:DNA helicase n=1 Tax=Tanacetum coccineum TaxID=301880 RepID=A0ABQ4WFI2_9ASTR
MFSMTSLGAQVDNSINNGRGLYVFKISGQLYQWIGSLCPAEGEPPRFLQLYIYDTDNEVDNRMSHFGGENSDLRYACFPNFKVRLYNVVGAQEYELPTGDMLGAIVYETGPESHMDYDIVLEERSGYPQRVNKLHSSYMSLQFPLLFVYGQDGYSKNLKMVDPTHSSSDQKRLSMLAFYSYQLHDRANCYNYLSRTGRLFQQYVVTAFCAIEQNRIDYVREHQNDIRNEYLSGIYDAINRGDSDGSDCGLRLILPQSFTSGPHYMYSHYLDALVICRVHGNPSFFITFTCNVKWPEIADTKRGLPHCHTLLWIHESMRVSREEDIDMYVSAELPSEDVDPECYNIVSEFMMHGPCGLACPSASCMHNSPRCKKNFPKEYCQRTYIDKNGFVHYKRRNTDVTTTRQNIKLDNSYVVPYNKKLLTTFYAHINVEYCGWSMLIKYLFKYISKGTDRVVARISRNGTNMSTPGASTTTYRPQVVGTSSSNFICTLDEYATLVFRERDRLDSIVVDTHKKKTTLTEWRHYNEWNTDGRHLTYLDFLSESITYTYLRYDDAIPHAHDGGEVELLYLREYLNTLSFVGLPLHRSMATTSISKSTAEEKGKMIVTKPDVTIIADLNPMDTNKTIEAVVYRKWSSKHVQTQQPMKYCCILLDKQLLQLHKAYKISGFSCEQTGLWERTLDNPTSLTFGKYIHLEEIPAKDFPEHYFNFASYNELAARADVRNAILTDYIGRIQAVSRIRTSGDATSNRIHRRIIDIQNLSAIPSFCALWHHSCQLPCYKNMKHCKGRVAIAVFLSSTSATHYYLNPNIPETFHIKQVHQQLPEPQVILNIENQRYENQEEEKTRNRFPLATIFDLDPQNYEGVRFTSEATIYKINTQKKWYYQRCASCRLQVIPGNPFPTCKNHGPQPIPVYSYCFKAIINDGTATMSLTCFSDNTNTFIRGCDDILAELPNKDPYELPSALKDLEGTTHVFQFHFDSGSTSRRRDLVLDRVFEKTVLPLPAPPPQVIPLEPIIEEQPRASQVPEPTAAPISKHQPEIIQHTKPLSPALSTTASNQPEVFEPETAETKEPQSTPPPTPETVKPIKGDQQTNLPKTSARKSLLKTEPELDTSKGTKKAKHDK